MAEVEEALSLALADPVALVEAASQLRHLRRLTVRERIARAWVDPGYEQLWRALARVAPAPVRRYCLEFAAACRWGTDDHRM
ncbi:hypothetical protein [Nocardioides insulae]|uniref:hypothetical protein n=1 Tax=Nocardioides insulae TaxID=394734 RepID=UPI0003F69E7E|nr:hypothetical protein [Nocardioides insulae]